MMIIKEIMKKVLSIMMAIFIVILYSACNDSDERKINLSDYKPMVYVKKSLYGETGNDSDEQEDNLSDYKPMIYVKKSLYGETGNIFDSISEKITLIGTVKKLVPQNEKMGKEEFSSNAMPLGSEIYLDETNSEIIYIKFFSEGKEKYAEYAIIK